jgi:hypothetical protein
MGTEIIEDHRGVCRELDNTEKIRPSRPSVPGYRITNSTSQFDVGIASKKYQLTPIYFAAELLHAVLFLSFFAGILFVRV